MATERSRRREQIRNVLADPLRYFLTPRPIIVLAFCRSLARLVAETAPVSRLDCAERSAVRMGLGTLDATASTEAQFSFFVARLVILTLFSLVIHFVTTFIVLLPQRKSRPTPSHQLLRVQLLFGLFAVSAIKTILTAPGEMSWLRSDGKSDLHSHSNLLQCMDPCRLAALLPQDGRVQRPTARTFATRSGGASSNSSTFRRH